MKPFLVYSMALLGALCSSCIMPPANISLTTTFDPDAAARMLAPGRNTISGSALIRQRGGGVVTCAGNEVTLVPATSYAIERMQNIYGSELRGYRSATAGAIAFQPESPEYHQAMITTLADAQGEFEFDAVADGDFFVTTSVIWQVGYSTEGGVLMARVTVSGGETQKVVLTP